MATGPRMLFSITSLTRFSSRNSRVWNWSLALNSKPFRSTFLGSEIRLSNSSTGMGR